jgi:antirestriction protein
MKVYIACLESYVNGILHGKWIDITKDLKEVRREIRQLLASSSFPNSEEWAMHDYEGFGDIRLCEYESLESLQKIALFVEEHGSVAEKLLSEFDMDLDCAKNAIEDCYIGQYESVAEYARDCTESEGGVPSHLQYYIDYDLMGKDLLLNGDMYSIETDYNSVHLFSYP